MLTINKIDDKSLNLDVHGQAPECWKDCYIAGHWECRSTRNTQGCVWYSYSYNAKKSIVY